MNYPEPTPPPDPEQTQEFVSCTRPPATGTTPRLFPNRRRGPRRIIRASCPAGVPFVRALCILPGFRRNSWAGLFLNAQALLIFGVLVAPLLTPWIGMTLEILAGSRASICANPGCAPGSSSLIFLSGFLAGLASRNFQPLNFNEAFTHSRLWWPDLTVLAIGAILLTVSFVRSEDRPYLPARCSLMNFFFRCVRRVLVWGAASVGSGRRALSSSWSTLPGRPSSA